MSWFASNRLLLLFAGVVLTTLGVIGLTVVGVVATLSALLGGGAALQTFAAFVLGTLLLAGLDLILWVALLREGARRASVPKSQVVADALCRVESLLPPLSKLGLADRFAPPEPTFDDRHEALTRRYVEGEITEAAYERRLKTLIEESDQRDHTGVQRPSTKSGPSDSIRDRHPIQETDLATENDASRKRDEGRESDPAVEREPNGDS